MWFPPSPTLSVCDSLDGIDLDAFLESQGTLSHFPTPPLQKTPLVQAIEVDDDLESGELDSVDYESSSWSAVNPHIVIIFAQTAGIDITTSSEDVEKVRYILIRAALPREILALAFSILSGLHSRVAHTGCFTETPPDLVVIAALSLAVTYTNDHAPKATWWSRRVSGSVWTARRIDEAILKILVHLDFSLHTFIGGESMQRALAKFSPRADILEPASQLHPISPTLIQDNERQPLKLDTQERFPCWNNGQMTPDDTPTASVCPELKPAGMRFLPLL